MHPNRGKSKNSKAANTPKQKISYEKEIDMAKRIRKLFNSP